jgi:isoamylase
MTTLNSTGSPQPFGATSIKGGYNFAIFSRHAHYVALCLFDKSKKLSKKIILDPLFNKTGDVWHIYIQENNQKWIYYAYQIEGPKDLISFYNSPGFVLDPYSRSLSTSNIWGAKSDLNNFQCQEEIPLGLIAKCPTFDWQNISKPQLPCRDLIIYEMHVRGFTIHPSSQVSHPGTFLGITEKIPYLLDLGINAVELMPIQEFDEIEVQRFPNPSLKDLYNYWGYSTSNFFSPMNRYATSTEDNAAIIEFKTMVRELHRNGIEVILDVVFNHTSEGNEKGPIISFKGIETSIYYMQNENGQFSNYSGCGNTFNCNHPIVRRFIIDCLRYWYLEMGIDGFRFDLASILTRGRDGEPLSYSPILEEITEDAVLASAKLIAEPWDAVGLYHVGNFVPHNKRWAEWNGRYRDAVRKFIKGTSQEFLKGEFITRICGSQDLYSMRSPLNSINFVTAHDGFTLCDLVSYNEKHNEANGENNQDGNPNNDSWNCGIEGSTKDLEIIYLRQRQMRNLHLALMISRGIPMLLMGDEYAHTKEGNNNTWCQDNRLNWFLWNQLSENQSFHRFYKKLILFRKKHTLLKRDSFLLPEEVEWHGLEPQKPEWDSHHRIVAFTLIDSEKQQNLYIVFNTENQTHAIKLPSPPDGMQWHWVVNTSNQPPHDFFDEEEGPSLNLPVEEIFPYSSWLLKAKRT